MCHQEAMERSIEINATFADPSESARISSKDDGHALRSCLIALVIFTQMRAWYQRITCSMSLKSVTSGLEIAMGSSSRVFNSSDSNHCLTFYMYCIACRTNVCSSASLFKLSLDVSFSVEMRASISTPASLAISLSSSKAVFKMF